MKKSPKNISDYFKKVFYKNGSIEDLEQIVVSKSDDPYFAEAYEGIKEIELSDRKSAISSLEQKITSKSKAHRKVLIPVLKFAASLALVVACCFLILNQFNSKEDIAFKPIEGSKKRTSANIKNNNEVSPAKTIAVDSTWSQPKANNPLTIDGIALNENFSPSQTSSVPEEENSSDDIYLKPGTGIYKRKIVTEVPIIQDEAIPPPIASAPIQSTQQAQTKEFENVDRAGAQSQPSFEADDLIAAKIQDSNDDEKKSELKDEESSVDLSKEEIIERLEQSPVDKSSPKSKAVVIRGNIRSPEGEVLIGVNVSIPNTSIGTVTDENGNFRLKSDSPNPDLDLSYIGYESKTIKYNGENMLNLSLENSSLALNEVIVTKSKSNQNFKFAKPDLGWKEFKTYIENNQRYPAEAKQNKIKGRVIVSFFVNEFGILSDFKIKRSLGYGCDEEAMRLLMEGPNWKEGKTNTVAEYTFRF